MAPPGEAHLLAPAASVAGMVRPRYETPQSKAEEDRIASLLEEQWGFEVWKTRAYCPFDRVMVKGGAVKAFCEIKVRKASYPTYWIGLDKWAALVTYSEAVEVPCALIVAWPMAGEEAVMAIRVKRGPRAIVMGGRRDRGDPDDIEPMVVLPIEEFDLIKIDKEK